MVKNARRLWAAEMDSSPLRWAPLEISADAIGSLKLDAGAPPGFGPQNAEPTASMDSCRAQALAMRRRIAECYRGRHVDALRRSNAPLDRKLSFGLPRNIKCAFTVTPRSPAAQSVRGGRREAALSAALQSRVQSDREGLLQARGAVAKKPPTEPSTASGIRSANCCEPSRQASAQTSSPQPDMTRFERKPL